MTTSTLTNPRPIEGLSPVVKDLVYVLQTVIAGAITNLPPVLFGLVAAYASSQFAADRGIFPYPFNVILASGFEVTLAGTLYFAGHIKNGRWYHPTVIMAASTSFLYVFMHSLNKYGVIEILLAGPYGFAWHILLGALHSAPIGLLSVMYMMLYHGAKQEENQERAFNARVLLDCPNGCGYRGTQQQLYGHSTHCKKDKQ